MASSVFAIASPWLSVIRCQAAVQSEQAFVVGPHLSRRPNRSQPRQTTSQPKYCHANGKARLAVQAAGLLVSIQRNLRRSERLLGLRPVGRRAETQHQGRLVAGHGHRTRRHLGPGRCASAYEMTGLDCTIIMHPQVWKCSGHYDLFHDYMVDCRESKRRYRHDQVRGRWAEAKGQRIFVATIVETEEEVEDTQARAQKFFKLRAKDADQLQWDGQFITLPEVTDLSQVFGPDAKTLGHADRTARVQFDVQDVRRRPVRRRRRGLPPPRDRPGYLRQLQERPRQHTSPHSVRHRADGQELSQRNHAAQFHLSLARVRTDGNRVLLPSGYVATMVPILARPTHEVVRRSWLGRRAAASARA